MTKKTGGAKWNAAAPDAVDGFVKGVGDESKKAADFAKKIAPELTDALHNRNRMMRVCHVHGEVASLRDVEKEKSCVEIYFLATRFLPVR